LHEPVGAKARVGILQLERVLVEILDVLVSPFPLPVERLFPLFSLADRVAEAGQPVRAAASRSVDRLGEFFLDQPRNVPLLAVTRLPLLVGFE
jgi:hypothetical protein